MPLIALHDVTKTYRSHDVETHALRGVTFSIDAGEFVAIMGPSGSGKSTLLHILGLLDIPTSGTYAFDGKDVLSYSDNERARLRNASLGFVFQQFHLLPRTSLLENVQLPLLYSTVPRSEWDARARRAIDSVGLTHRLRHDPSELSGGEKQRAAIARALVLNPKILFADEPTGNLDSVSGGAVMAILEHLHRDEHRTILLITHETYTAEHAERIIRLHDGTIASDAPVTARVNGGFKK